MKTKVICISGKAQHGKDTTANMLYEELKGKNKAALVIHYADLLKYICTQYFCWNGVKDERGRSLLQYVGTDVVRTKKPDFWVDFVIDVLKLFDGEWDYVLIPDCRFPNEIDHVRDAGFETVSVRVVRSGFKSPLTKNQQRHPSEIALDDYTFDHILMNTGGLDDLKKKITDWIEEGGVI